MNCTEDTDYELARVAGVLERIMPEDKDGPLDLIGHAMNPDPDLNQGTPLVEIAYQLDKKRGPWVVNQPVGVSDWTGELAIAGLQPVIAYLEVIPAQERGEAEAKWIRTLRAEGHGLFNTIDPTNWSNQYWHMTDYDAAIPV